MKAEERHHLQQNELNDWLVRLTASVWPYRSHIAIALLLMVAAICWFAYSSHAQAESTSEAWAEFFKADTPELLETLIKNYPGTPAVAYARLRIADARFQEGKQKLTTNRFEALQKLDEAIRLYEYLANDPSSPTDVRERAEYSSALAAESKGALDEAKKEYARVAAQFSGTPDAILAEQREKAIEKPRARAFYAFLADWKPPAASTDLPSRENPSLDPSRPPTRVDEGKAAPASKPGMPLLDLKREDVPVPPKSATTEKKPAKTETKSATSTKK